ncbi:unnamed protein product [Ranitomeya imitator]|uniref:Cytochrome P450 n=1 Tax=Ranitomeya imitator TaxID=111125 RepID=A0ABN9MWP4_9NEOB|nr:unnamed protein product [Ranitomeya imitator]
MALSEDVHLIWLSAAIVLLTLLAISATPFLTEYIRKWNIMKPIPGFSPTYPIIGNALRFKPNGGAYIEHIKAYGQGIPIQVSSSMAWHRTTYQNISSCRTVDLK